MLLLDQLLKEHRDDPGWSRYEAQVSSSGCIVLTETRFSGNDELHKWEYSILAHELDPRLVEVLEPNSQGIRYLQVVSSLYRSAIVGTLLSAEQPPKEHRFVKIGLPLAAEIPDTIRIAESFRQFLASNGGKSPTILPAAIQDLLSPLRDGLTSANGMTMREDDKITFEQSIRLDEDRLLLICERGRRIVIGESLPVKSVLDSRHTLEVLSVDTNTIDVRQAPDCWTVSLNAVERLETVVRENPPYGESRWPYMKLMFSREAEAKRFAQVCADSIPRLRDRLYNLNYPA